MKGDEEFFAAKAKVDEAIDRDDRRTDVSSLLSRALAIPFKSHKSVFPPEEIELALAFLDGRVERMRVLKVLGMKEEASLYNWCGRRWRQAYEMGLLKIACKP